MHTLRTKLIGAGVALAAAVGAAPAAAESSAATVGLDVGWVSNGASQHATLLAFSVPGTAPGRPGNLHAGYIDADIEAGAGYISAHLTDYRCPAGVDDVRQCITLARFDGTARVSEGDGVQFVGRVGLDIDTTAVSATKKQLPVHLSLRPADGTSYSVSGNHEYGDLSELWISYQPRPQGTIGGVEPARGTLDGQNALYTGRRYTWSGAGGPAARRAHDRATWTRVPQGYRFAGFTWHRGGELSGHPGNAHTGWSRTRAAEDPASPGQANGEWNDWQCPAGVRPPAFAKKHSPCRLLRTELADPHDVADRPTGKYGFSVRGWLPTRIVSADGVTSGHAAAELRMSPAGTHARWRYVEQADGTLTVNDFFSGTVSTGRFGPVDVDDTAVTVAGGPFESARVWSKTG